MDLSGVLVLRDINKCPDHTRQIVIINVDVIARQDADAAFRLIP
jgi:hypothetical protein